MHMEFSKTNCKRKGLDTSLTILGKQEAPTDGMRAADRNMHVTEENMTTVCELVGPLSQEGPKQTHRSTRQITKDTSRYRMIQIIHRDFGVVFVYQHACCLLLLVFLTFMFHKVV